MPYINIFYILLLYVEWCVSIDFNIAIQHYVEIISFLELPPKIGI